MSDAGDQKATNRPDSRAQVAPRGYYVAAGFHPRLHLNRKSGFEFAATLSDYIDPSNAELGETEWVYSQTIGSSPHSRLRVTVGPARIQIHGEFPSHSQEWFEERFGVVLQRFRERFKPELVLGSKAMVRGLLPVEGDARVFLAEHLMNIDARRVGPFARPIHLLGLRFSLPAYVNRSREGATGADWSVNVRVESLMEDPSQLFLEADADWPEPFSWEESTGTKLVERLQAVGDYLRKNVVAFLRASGGDQDMEH